MTNPYDRLETVPAFTLTSTDVEPGGEMPTAQRSGIFGAGGTDTSPQLAWSGFPASTKSFAVSMYDPAAPTPSGFWHWMMVDIPADVTELPAGAADSPPAGAVAIRNDSGQTRFIGCAPPAGTHDYYIVVHALDVATIGADENATPPLLSFMMIGHVVGRAVLVAKASA